KTFTEMPSERTKRGARKGSKGTKSQRSGERAPTPQNPEDAKVPLKFRMEEQAYTLLESNLAKNNLCPAGYQIEESKFERARYKIKGYCSMN
ncbi:MAG: hypothetical protein OQJ89_16130, partial [Kangiellaceae bacterium]|nr:hypothetical protein [Kangiellaceae bacterium]